MIPVPTTFESCMSALALTAAALEELTDMDPDQRDRLRVQVRRLDTASLRFGRTEPGGGT